MTDMHTTEDTHTTEWALELAAANYRPRTIKAHTGLIKTLERHAGKPAIEVERRDLIKFLARPELSGSTRQHYRSTLRLFFSWLQDENHRADNPSVRLPRVHVVVPEPNPVETADIEPLLESVYFLTRVKILLYAYQGLRASEIAAVSGEHLDHSKGILHVPEGKGGKEAWLPIHPIIREVAKNMPKEGFWFPSPKIPGRHVRGNSVSRTISDAMKRAGIKHRPHQLRAWYATQMLRNGTDSAIVQAAMRHSSIETLKRYARPSLEQTSAALDALPVVEIPTKTTRRPRAA